MTAIAWPDTLPSHALREGYQETGPTAVVESEMETGPPKRRRQAAVTPGEIRCVLRLTQAQVGGLDAFFETTTRYGALRFRFPHPRTATNVDVRFAERPRVRPHTPGMFKAELRLQLLEGL